MGAVRVEERGQQIAVVLETRCEVGHESYLVMVQRHHALHDSLGTPADALCRRCLSHPRDCRCYWPERVNAAPHCTCGKGTS